MWPLSLCVLVIFVASVSALAGDGSVCLGCAGFLWCPGLWAVAQAWVYILVVSLKVSWCLCSNFFLYALYIFFKSLVGLVSAFYILLLISWV